MVKAEESALPPFIKLAYLPNSGMVRLRLTASGEDKDLLTKELDTHFQAFKESVKEFLVIDEDLPIEAVVAKILKEKKATFATAESCTGGYIAHLLTSMPGASAYFKGTVVSYDNSIKTKVLQVPERILETVGAVSEETVKIMAESVREIMDTDYSIAVSGIMGPDGGTKEKPVGMVWIAIAKKGETIAKRFDFRYTRDRNIQLTGINALNMLRITICG